MKGKDEWEEGKGGVKERMSGRKVREGKGKDEWEEGKGGGKERMSGRKVREG